MARHQNKGNGAPKLKYYGNDGEPTSMFVEAVKSFPVVQGDAELARDICKKCEIRNYKAGEFISHQGAEDDCAYFILSGRVNVRVNDNNVVEREAKELVGEMAIMSFAAKRCASLVAIEDVTVLKINRETFNLLTNTYPEMVKRMFNILADRLRERNEQFRSPNCPPLVFVGSSTGGKGFAHQFVDKVKSIIEKSSTRKRRGRGKDDESLGPVSTINVKYWDKDVFSISGITLNTLIEESKKVDFAVFVLTKDDLTVKKKGDSKWCPRDNVIFEAGLFMGALSQDRTFLAMDETDFKRLKLPSDWQGFTLAVFNKKVSRSLTNKAKEVANKICAQGGIGGFKK